MFKLIKTVFSLGVVRPIAAVGGALVLLRPRTHRGQVMWTLFLYGISGLFIAIMAIWWGSSVYDKYIASSAKITLGEIEVIGTADATSGELLKKVMPVMLVAELATLKAKAKAALVALSEADDAANATPTPQDFRYADIPVQFELFKVPDINLKIGETDVSFLVKWFIESAAEESRLKLTVALENESKKARIFGFVPAQDDRAFAIDSSNEPSAVVRSIASAILQQQAAQGRDEIGQLSTAEFETFIDALSQFAALERARRLFGPGSQDDYKSVLQKVAPLADKTKGWLDFQWITALISERAGDTGKAADYYRSIRTSDKIEAAVASWLDKKIESLEEPTPTEESNHEFVARTLSDDEARPVWSLLGIDKRNAAANATVGVVGPPPYERLRALISEITLPVRSSVQQAEGMENYVTHLVQAIRLVCDGNRYVFAGSSASQISDLLEGLKALAGVDGIDVILFSYGSSDGNKAVNLALRNLAERSLVVVSAGNSSGEPSPYAELVDEIAVVGAVNNKGEPARFSAVGPGLIWAPGDNIPFPGPGSPTSLDRQSGTGYAAAIVAGIAATLKADFPKATPAQLLAALKESQQRPSDSKPSSINLERARESLRKVFAQPT
jgi:subtilisin family serine protease